MKRFILILIVLLAFSVPAWAVETVMYVDTAGSNTSPYDTWAKAATALETAVDAISAAHTTIYVDGGTHVPGARLLFDNSDGGSGTEVVMWLNAGLKQDGGSNVAAGAQTMTILDMTNTGGGTSAIYINKDYTYLKSYKTTSGSLVKWKIISVQAGDSAINAESTADYPLVWDSWILDSPGALFNEGTNISFQFNLVEGTTGGAINGYGIESNAGSTGTIAYNVFTSSDTNYFGGFYIPGNEVFYNNTVMVTGIAGFGGQRGWFAGTNTAYNNIFMGGGGSAAMVSGTLTEDHNIVYYGKGFSPNVFSEGYVISGGGTINGQNNLSNLGANTTFLSADITAHRRFGYVFVQLDDSGSFDDAIALAVIANANGQYVSFALEADAVNTGSATSAAMTIFVNDGNDFFAHGMTHQNLDATKSTTAITARYTGGGAGNITGAISGDSGTYYTSGNVYTDWTYTVTLDPGGSQAFTGTDSINVVQAFINGKADWTGTVNIAGGSYAVGLQDFAIVDAKAGDKTIDVDNSDFSVPGRFLHIELYDSKAAIEFYIDDGAAGGSRAENYVVKGYAAANADITDTDIHDQIALAGYKAMRRSVGVALTPTDMLLNSWNPFQIANSHAPNLVPSVVTSEDIGNALGAAIAGYMEERGLVLVFYEHNISAGNRTKWGYVFAGALGAPVANFKTKLNDFIDMVWDGTASPNGEAFDDATGCGAGDKANPDNTLRFCVDWLDWDDYMDWTPVSDGDAHNTGKSDAHSITRDYLGNTVPVGAIDIGPYERASGYTPAIIMVH